MIGEALRAWAWFDLQVAIWSVLLLPAAVIVALALRGRLPVWRKGLWLVAMLVPPLLVCAAILLPAGSHWVPADWFSHAGGGGLAAEPGRVPILAALLYGGWVGLNLLLEAGGGLRLRRLLKHASPLATTPVAAAYTRLLRAVGCARAPRLVQSQQASSPFIVASPWSGLTIVLPQSLVTARPDTALRAVLAHELAHARAGDPWIGRLLSALRCLLPLTWLSSMVASRIFWEDAAEETGDVRALRASGLSAADYALALKELAMQATAPAPSGALSFTPEMAHLSSTTRRLVMHLIGRIHALRLAGRWSEPVVHSAGSCGRALVAGALLFVLAGRSEVQGVLLDPRRPANIPAAAVPVFATVPAAVPAQPAVSVVPNAQPAKPDVKAAPKPDPKRDAREEQRQIDNTIEQRIRNHEGLEL